MTDVFEKSPGVAESEVLMTRTTHRGAILLVEGPDDHRFWTSRVDCSCAVVKGSGKKSVEEAVLRLEAKRTPGILGIVDDDHDSIRGVALTSPNIVRTDAHDLECVLLRANTLDRILAEYGDPSLIATFEKQANCNVASALIMRGLPFGRLRLLSFIHNWGLNFKTDLAVARFIHRPSWTLDEDRLKATARANGCPLDTSGLDKELARFGDLDPWLVCHGHDLVDILALGLCNALGHATGVGTKQIGAVLRSAAEMAVFSSCGLCNAIEDWQKRNVPYLVLPQGHRRKAAASG